MSDRMTAAEASGLYELLSEGGVSCWVMGGWGVDALLGRQTRDHKDLDLLVRRLDLPAYTEITRSAGFTRGYVWSENLPVTVDGATYDSAFVDRHPDGREIDVHVIEVEADETVVQLHQDPWPLPQDALSGRGTVGGKRVPCVSRAAQLAMHSGYDLPDTHRDDVRLLEAEQQSDG